MRARTLKASKGRRRGKGGSYGDGRAGGMEGREKKMRKGEGRGNEIGREE
jgi:hypothetical protein